uniref:carboxyl transferase domain-containing protein n=1 Tax=Nocardia farcinica TaxID=37329 RepID=UPI0024545B28
APDPGLGAGERAFTTPMGATVVELAEPGTLVAAGGRVAVLEAMKMQHVLRAEEPLRVLRRLAAAGEVVDPGAALLVWTPAEHADAGADVTAVDLDAIRPDLREVLDRRRGVLDEARQEAVAKRRRLGRRTARENIDDLVDAGSFVEYGRLAVAAQRLRRSPEDLIANTPADGLVAGVATVNAEQFGERAARAVVLSYDYTVLAGTQGMRNHAKSDRMLELAHEQRLPVVFFTEGGGGRPGDTDYSGISGLDLTTFRAMGALSGRVPLIGIVSGRCFAGNAALLGMCDVVIATPDANIGMGGPAMIEGGGLGVFRPEDIGPVEVQRRNGVVHVVAGDEAEAVAVARRYLAYFQGATEQWEAPDPRLARHVVPENRLHAFDIRAAVEAIVDVGSVLELRRDWGVGIVTALVRVEGRPFGLIANDCHHLGGAIDAPAADKLSAFLALCDAHRLPILSLCDTPGFMVGPDAEKQATVTKFSRLFVDAARMRVPWGTVVLRKGYGLGAQAMAAGSFRSPRFIVSWPTGEIGGMGLEGAVRLGFAKELAAIADPAERQKAFDALVAAAYAGGKALTAATVFELDDVIDPADTRRWIRLLR